MGIGTSRVLREKRKVVNPELYLISDQTGAVCGRLPGENSYVFVYDYVNTVTIDDCSNCTIIFGPIQTSVFIRFCENCTILTACQQFRVRDSKSIIAFIASVSEPIIETSSLILFAPFQLFYPELQDQFRAAGLNLFNCSYSSIHDFSARSTSPANYAFLPLSDDISKHIRLPKDLEAEISSGDNTVRIKAGEVLQRLKSVHASLDADLSTVPITYAGLLIDGNVDGEFALVGLFYHHFVERHAREVIKTLSTRSVYLVRTRSLQYSREDITRIFGDSTLASHSLLGPMITLQFQGPTGEVGRLCQAVVSDLVRRESIKPTTLIHVTQDSLTASRQADMLAHFPVLRS
ncbi:Protein XRP2 [Echinococcus granulosus]|nr:Protein XRP2 [Echinococcus granulosus]